MLYTNDQLLDFIKIFYIENNKVPSSQTFHDFGYPYSTVYKRRFGSWRNAIELAGLACRSAAELKILTMCAQCQNEILKTYSQKNKSKSGLFFCDRSCAASYNNSNRVLSKETKDKIGNALRKPSREEQQLSYERQEPIETDCLFCKTKFTYNPKATTGKYCSIKCQAMYRWYNDTCQRILNGEVKNSKLLRKYLIETHGYKCSDCSLDTWQEQPIPLCLDHIDGNAANNFPNNLRLLCQNCHGLTPTFAGRNKGNGRKTRGIILEYSKYA